MEVYVDLNQLDDEDLPSSICNQYKLKINRINSGSEYNCKIKSLEQHDAEIKKQERERVINEVRAYYTTQPYDRIPAHTDVRVLLDRLDKIKQEDTSNE